MFMLFAFQSYLALTLDCDSFEVCLLLFLSLEHVEEFGNFQESARARVNLKVKQELLQKSNKSDFKSQTRVTSKSNKCIIYTQLYSTKNSAVLNSSWLLNKSTEDSFLQG